MVSTGFETRSISIEIRFNMFQYGRKGEGGGGAQTFSVQQNLTDIEAKLKQFDRALSSK